MKKSKLSEIKTGDIMLVSTDSWLGHVIQETQEIQDPVGGKFNHGGVFWWCYDVLMVIESDVRGPRITPFEDLYIKHDKYKAIIGLRPKETIIPKIFVDGSEYGKYMLPFCGKAGYNYFGLLWELIKFRLNIWLGRKKPNENKFMCGEWCAHVYNHFNPNMFPEEPKIAPVDLYQSEYFDHYIIKPV